MSDFEWVKSFDLDKPFTEDQIHQLGRNDTCVNIPFRRDTFRLDKLPARETLLVIATITYNRELLRCGIDAGINPNTETECGRPWLYANFDYMQFALIDAGATTNGRKVFCTTKRFIQSRDAARSAAIVLMWVLKNTRKTCGNVAKMHARVIWESREKFMDVAE